MAAKITPLNLNTMVVNRCIIIRIKILRLKFTFRHDNIRTILHIHHIRTRGRMLFILIYSTIILWITWHRRNQDPSIIDYFPEFLNSLRINLSIVLNLWGLKDCFLIKILSIPIYSVMTFRDDSVSTSMFEWKFAAYSYFGLLERISLGLVEVINCVIWLEEECAF